MKSRTGIQGVASSPVIVGAITVLIIIVAMFLAYNANNGLPFVSTYNVKAQVPNANALVKGNEVRIGGSRVGIVSEVVPVQLDNGELAAELNLKLDESAKPNPGRLDDDHPPEIPRSASSTWRSSPATPMPASMRGRRCRSPPPAPNRSTSISSSTCSTSRRGAPCRKPRPDSATPSPVADRS